MTNTADDDQQQKTVLYNYDEAIEVISQSLQTATMEVNICADCSTPSITVGVDTVRKALVQLKDRGVKLRYITEITSNNLPYCKELADFAELRHIDKLIGSQLITEKEFIAGAFLQATRHRPRIAYSNVKEIVDQQKCMFDTIWNMAIPGEQKIKEV